NAHRVLRRRGPSARNEQQRAAEPTRQERAGRRRRRRRRREGRPERGWQSAVSRSRHGAEQEELGQFGERGRLAGSSDEGPHGRADGERECAGYAV
ncbi:hypothetical protein LTR04_005456, partial [Oleoguttula sp. CCFEE 6159]